MEKNYLKKLKKPKGNKNQNQNDKDIKALYTQSAYINYLVRMNLSISEKVSEKNILKLDGEHEHDLNFNVIFYRTTLMECPRSSRSPRKPRIEPD